MLQFEFNLPIQPKSLCDLREAVGWNRMEQEYGDPALSSFYHIAVYDADRLIGYVDCVSNGVTDAYIQDLMVHPDYQNRGIGTKLMNRMLSYLKEKHIYVITVVFDDALQNFYGKFGFRRMLGGQLETYESK